METRVYDIRERRTQSRGWRNVEIDERVRKRAMLLSFFDKILRISRLFGIYPIFQESSYIVFLTKLIGN